MIEEEKKNTILSDYCYYFFLRDGTIYKHNWKTGPKQKQHINNYGQLNSLVRTSFDAQAKMPLNHCNGVDRTWKIWYSAVITMEVVPNC